MPRLPSKPERDEILSEELDDYDYVVQVRAGLSKGFQETAGPSWKEHPKYGGDKYYFAMLNSPPLAAIMTRHGRVLYAQLNKPGTLTEADHMFMDIVISVKLGNYALIASTLSRAVAEGVRFGALEAVWEHRLDDLSDDERLQVDFIHAVVAMEMTDELWDRMLKRLGTVRGVVEYSYLAAQLHLPIKLMHALGIPSITNDEIDELFNEIRAGARPLPKTIDERRSAGVQV